MSDTTSATHSRSGARPSITATSSAAACRSSGGTPTSEPVELLECVPPELLWLRLVPLRTRAAGAPRAAASAAASDAHDAAGARARLAPCCGASAGALHAAALDCAAAAAASPAAAAADGPSASGAYAGSGVDGPGDIGAAPSACAPSDSTKGASAAEPAAASPSSPLRRTRFAPRAGSLCECSDAAGAGRFASHAGASAGPSHDDAVSAAGPAACAGGCRGSGVPADGGVRSESGFRKRPPVNTASL